MKLIIIGVLQGSLLGTIAFTFLLLLKQSAQKRCGARAWQYFILIATVLFVVPIILPSQMLSAFTKPVHEWIRAYLLPVPEEQSVMVQYIPLRNDRVYNILFYIWLIGMIIYLVIRCLLNVVFTKNIQKGLKPASDIESNVLKGQLLSDKTMNKFGSMLRVELYIHDDIFSPITYGFWHNKIVLPSNIVDKYTPEEIFSILRHEVVHIAHNDSWKRLLHFIVHASNWFNPLLILLEKNLDEALEIYCDHDTISDKADENKRYQYSDMLVSMINTNRQRATVGMSLLKKGIMEKRLTFTMQAPKKPERFFVGLISLFLCIITFTCVLGFTEEDSRAPNLIPTGITDYGIPIPRLSKRAEYSSYDLTEQGEYLLEMQLYPNTVNYTPELFTTDTQDICLTLLTSDCSVVVNLYIADNEDNPIMQFVLGKDNPRNAFSGVLYDYTYLLGMIVNEDVDVPVQILITD